MIYLVNSFALNMYPIERIVFDARPTLTAKIAHMLAKPELQPVIVNAIGHKTTDKLVRQELGRYKPTLIESLPKAKRVTVRCNVGEDLLFVANYRGERLEENQENLPDKAFIQFWTIGVAHYSDYKRERLKKMRKESILKAEDIFYN